MLSSLKKQTVKVTFKTLLKRTECKKGKYLKYERLELVDYLLQESEVSAEDEREIFNIRTEINDFPFNFGSKILCDMGCKDILESEHLLSCSE